MLFRLRISPLANRKHGTCCVDSACSHRLGPVAAPSKETTPRESILKINLVHLVWAELESFRVHQVTIREPLCRCSRPFCVRSADIKQDFNKEDCWFHLAPLELQGKEPEAIDKALTVVLDNLTNLRPTRQFRADGLDTRPAWMPACLEPKTATSRAGKGTCSSQQDYDLRRRRAYCQPYLPASELTSVVMCAAHGH